MNNKNINQHLIWLDLEMSGLNPDINTILQIAIIVTDKYLNIVDSSIDLAIYQNDFVLDNMDSWNKENHSKNGLIERCRTTDLSMARVESIVLKYLKGYGKPQELILCGNTISNDAIFLKKYMPSVSHFLHYRSVDVSSIKELAFRWYPQLPRFEKKNTHNAITDIYESIEELKYYKEKIFLE